MFPLFRKRKRSKAAQENTAQDKLAQNFVIVCLRLQSKWAGWMQGKSERLSGKTKLILLLVFIGLVGGYSLYLIAENFLYKGTSTFYISPIKKPEHVQQSGDVVMPHEAFISEEEYQRINGFKLYMDSMARSPSGKNLFDSIATARPGLMDSILIIEKIYQPQTKK